MLEVFWLYIFLIFQIGVGENVDFNQLELIASRPVSHHVITASDVSDLSRSKKKLLEQICKSTFPCKLLLQHIVW